MDAAENDLDVVDCSFVGNRGFGTCRAVPSVVAVYDRPERVPRAAAQETIGSCWFGIFMVTCFLVPNLLFCLFLSFLPSTQTQTLCFHTVVHFCSLVVSPTHMRSLKLVTENQSFISHGRGVAVIVPQELLKVNQVINFRTRNDVMLEAGNHSHSTDMQQLADELIQELNQRVTTHTLAPPVASLPLLLSVTCLFFSCLVGTWEGILRCRPHIDAHLAGQLQGAISLHRVT